MGFDSPRLHVVRSGKTPVQDLILSDCAQIVPPLSLLVVGPGGGEWSIHLPTHSSQKPQKSLFEGTCYLHTAHKNHKNPFLGSFVIFVSFCVHGPVHKKIQFMVRVGGVGRGGVIGASGVCWVT